MRLQEQHHCQLNTVRVCNTTSCFLSHDIMCQNRLMTSHPDCLQTCPGVWHERRRGLGFDSQRMHELMCCLPSMQCKIWTCKYTCSISYSSQHFFIVIYHCPHHHHHHYLIMASNIIVKKILSGFLSCCYFLCLKQDIKKSANVVGKINYI